MLIYNKKSGSNVVHYSHCRHIKGRKQDVRVTFDTPEEARAAGYRLCKCCAPMTKFYKKEAKALEQFATENGLSYFYGDGMLDIKSPYSQWKVIVAGKDIKRLFIYHKNTQTRAKQKPSIVPGYHSQAYRTDTLLGYMQFILSHDAFHLERDGVRYAYNPAATTFVPSLKPPAPPAKKSKQPHTKRQLRALKRGNRLSCVGKVYRLIEEERRKQEAMEQMKLDLAEFEMAHGVVSC